MTTKEKAARAGTRTASDTAIDKQDSTVFDPLKGWYSLGQSAKEQQQRTPKNTARYGKGQRGRIDAYLFALLALMLVSAALIVGGLAYA